VIYLYKEFNHLGFAFVWNDQVPDERSAWHTMFTRGSAHGYAGLALHVSGARCGGFDPKAILEMQ